MAGTCSGNRVRCRPVGAVSPVIAGRAQAARTASLGYRVCAENSKP
ncbi:hypothetical protein [Streptomyces cyanogenus]|uniref:Uncharacterized protein n=1 Tax=Streptomyces cyanogenus TaxID=80860 RepID=A0ABX7TT96_STRCY|nr:hypothetical protein S1361_14190 [Streptomyces cyanogenus]